MPVKVTLDMDTRADADAIKESLGDPMLRAVVVISGTLLKLPIAMRRQVLTIVTHTVTSNGEVAPPQPPAEYRAPLPLDELPAMRLGLGRDTGE